MKHAVQFGLRRPDGLVTPAPQSLPRAREKADELGAEVVCRVVMLGVWGGLPGGRCPVHFLTHCAECGWTL